MIALAAAAAAFLVGVVLGYACRGSSDSPWSDGRANR